METVRIKFPSRDSGAFVEELKQQVSQYFEETGISPKANLQMVLKTVFIFVVTFGSYGLILSGWFSPWQMLFLAILMGLGSAGIGFNISHDALHGAYSSSTRVNKILGLTFDLVGANGYMWKITHNIIHHTYPNIHGLDEDLEVSPFLRLSPGAKLRWIHKYQHIYAFFLYAQTALFWVFVKDFKYFLQRDIGPYKGRSHPKSQIATLVFMKLLYLSYIIVLPLAILDITWWQFLIGFLAMHLAGGFALGIVFQLAHVVEATDYPAANDDGAMDKSWTVHQFETTSNFATKNRWVSWYVGGLNFQIEHHLFPKICSIHYPAINKIVREVAERYDIGYNHYETFRAAVRSHYTSLKSLGRPLFAPSPS